MILYFRTRKLQKICSHASEAINKLGSKMASKLQQRLIKKSLDETKASLKLKPDVDLTKGFYQSANRLAHLYLLRELNDVSAYLVFVYFVNDHTHIPTTRD